MICKSWQYPSHSLPSTLDSTPCPLSSFASFSRNVTTRSLHNAYLLSPSIDAVGRGHFEKGDVCKFESDSTLSREVDRLRKYCSDTRRTVLADDDASMFHGNHKPWRIHFGISIIYRLRLPCSFFCYRSGSFGDRSKNFSRNYRRDNVVLSYY